LLANGVINAEVSLPRQLVRLRILNGEIERNYNLGFADGRSFYAIGNDGGLLAAPVAVKRLLMAPGDRECGHRLAGNTGVGRSRPSVYCAAAAKCRRFSGRLRTWR